MKTDSFEADLRRALARRAAGVPGEAVERLQHRHYRPRTHGRARMAGAGLAGAAAAATALGIAMSQPGGHPSSHPGSRPAKAQLAAWTVTKRADGTVHVALREMRNPAGLQRRLRADGVPASVNIGANPACQAYPLRATPAQRRKPPVTFHQGPSRPTIILIHSSALPSGAGLEISAVSIGPGHELGTVVMHLVRTSQRCTGS
jgi:hypothetical protein